MPEPYVMSSPDKINTVFLPICSDKILIGCRNLDRLPGVSGFNEVAAACCQTFFVSARKAEPRRGLGGGGFLIGVGSL